MRRLFTLNEYMTIYINEQMKVDMKRRVLPGEGAVTEYPPLGENWQEHCLHPIVKLSRHEDHNQHFLRVPSETIQRRLGMPNEHTYIVDADLCICVCLRSLAADEVTVYVKYCITGGEPEHKQLSTMQPNTEWNLQALILSVGEADNELHMYDRYQRELLTLRFKVNAASVGSSGPSTMTLPDIDVIDLLIEYGLEYEIEHLAGSGIHTLEQLRNMTDEHISKYKLRLAFRNLIEKLSAKKLRSGGKDVQMLLVRMQAL